MGGRPAVVPALALMAGLLGASVGLQVLRDRWFATDRPAEQLLYVQSPEVVGRLVLSYDALAADLYWIRALQHFGGTHRRGEKTPKYELLHPLLDLATSLDPYFNIAYRFGSTFLSQPRPGPGRPDLAIALLQKGLRHSPQKWQYMQDAGFVEYWGNHDYPAAAAWFERASTVPGAPDWLKPLAAVTLAQGGRRDASRFLFRTILESAGDNTWTRNDAARRLRQLDAMDQSRSVAPRCRGVSRARWRDAHDLAVAGRCRHPARPSSRSGRLRVRARPVERRRLAPRALPLQPLPAEVPPKPYVPPA